MHKSLEKMAEISHLLRPFTAWFSVWRCFMPLWLNGRQNAS
jgi:hypothetical protein